LRHKRTLFCARALSALPPKADIADRRGHVRFVPKADMQTILWLSPKRCSFDEIASGIPTAVSRLNYNGSTIDSRLATSQVMAANCTRDRTVANPELGIKRLCASCGAKFYDLNKDPIHCPKCGAVYEVVVATRSVRAAGPVTARPPVPKKAPAPEPQEVETASLEEAEAQGAAKKPAPAEAGIAEEEEVEMDDSLDNDDTLIEEQEGESADVTDIIGGDIKNTEEG
jgi:uncharacterized protein (TIGR02300 family)